MKNFKQPGDILSLTAPAGGVISGQAALFGALFGVAAKDAAEGKKVSVRVEGVVTLPKATGAGITEGAKAYWITADKKITATAGGNTLVGNAVEAVGTDATSVAVRLSN